MRAGSLGVLAMIALLVLPGAPAYTAGGQRCAGRLPTVVGTVGNDRIRGTKRADVIVGLTGRDIIRGRGGRDRICGNRGRDDLRGGERRDRLEGNRGNDTLAGGQGRNRLSGGLGKRDYCIVNDDRYSGCELVEVPGDSVAEWSPDVVYQHFTTTRQRRGLKRVEDLPCRGGNSVDVGLGVCGR